MKLLLSLHAVLLATMVQGQTPKIARSCETLSALDLSETTIVSAASLPAGSFTPPDWRDKANLPAFCRVVGRIGPAVNFEVWLPASGWNGKFLGVGNAGLGGSISYDAMVSALTRGYATASTDTGHIGTGNAPGQYARWALGHPELIVDHAYRAIHEMTVKGKAIVEAFYAERPRISYFTGCSTGGRQGLLAACV
jgi:feruloyl esterase